MEPSLVQIIFLALIQGLTEFLPVSSSAHLILAPLILGVTDQGLAMDVAVHVGTLGAVVVYFRQDLRRLVQDSYTSLQQRKMHGEGELGWGILIATIPLAVCGLLFNDLISRDLRSPIVIALATILFGIVLWFADYHQTGDKTVAKLGWRGLLLIGLAQALALIPGTSRSGITMTAGLLLGLDRTAASRISFLLSVPAILLAGGYQFLQLLLSTATVAWSDFALAAGLAGISAWLCIKLFLATIQKIGMTPFVIYRLLFGVALLIIFA